MINIFSLILMSMTFITGILWFLKKIIIIKNKIQLTSKTVNYSSWRETLISIFPVLLLVFLIRSFLYEPFQIPSSSMLPTLFVGDFILVEKFSYGIINPITQKIIFLKKKPKRGDVTVFKYPENIKFNYIKRVIGLPGDEIVYNSIEKTITINPLCLKNQRCDIFPVKYSNVSFEDMSKDFKNLYKNKEMFKKNLYFTEKNNLNIIVRNENIGDKKHYILLDKDEKNSLYYLNKNNIFNYRWIVPKDQYFMLGDNRDNSFDSRYWGFVPEKNLVGKAVFIWMSFEKKENQFPTGIRFKRIGKIY